MNIPRLTANEQRQPSAHPVRADQETTMPYPEFSASLAVKATVILAIFVACAAMWFACFARIVIWIADDIRRKQRQIDDERGGHDDRPCDTY